MPMELLRVISAQRLPLTVTNRTEVDKLRTLQAAGHVMALVSPPAAAKPFANVLTLTRSGLAALKAESSLSEVA